MNAENVGIQIAKITNKEDEKFNELTISIEPDKDKVENYFEEIVIPKNQKHVKMQHMPYKTTDKTYRQILYITGASGSGKSYYSLMYINEYQKMFPKNAVYLFSSLSQDNTIDKVKNLKRVKLDEKFYNTPFTIQSFKDCLLIFDDCETIKHPLLREKIKNITDLVLETGRHQNTWVIITSHVATNRERTKLILTEAHSVTIFLATIGGNSLEYLLKGYFGLNKQQIEKIEGLESRWVTIIKTYPMTVLYEKGFYVLTKKKKL
jgi:chromosomal replication initiation ATPase DnaA